MKDSEILILSGFAVNGLALKDISSYYLHVLFSVQGWQLPAGWEDTISAQRWDTVLFSLPGNYMWKYRNVFKMSLCVQCFSDLKESWAVLWLAHSFTACWWMLIVKKVWLNRSCRKGVRGSSYNQDCLIFGSVWSEQILYSIWVFGEKISTLPYFHFTLLFPDRKMFLKENKNTVSTLNGSHIVQ